MNQLQNEYNILKESSDQKINSLESEINSLNNSVEALNSNLSEANNEYYTLEAESQRNVGLVLNSHWMFIVT
jgi:predicted  nucleic acid-binding Zn-ribbon protein